jgi:prepilin-type processing-associated H-X9-DG protein
MNGRCRKGLSLVETLVVIGVIALLLSLLIPAVSSIRESSLKFRCSNNLRQLGVSLNNYLAAHSSYPSTSYPTEIVDGALIGGRHLSAFAHLAPFWGDDELANSLNTTLHGGYSTWVADDNMTAAQRTVSLLLCPSDSPRFPRMKGNVNYRFCVGASSGLLNFRHQHTSIMGAFPALEITKPADITDGLSKTVGLSEKTLGDADDINFARAGDFYITNLDDTPPWHQLCQQAEMNNQGHYSYGGYNWLGSGFENTVYNHLSPPNDATPDCTTARGQFASDGSFTARSRHRSGVNALYLDGSVHWSADSIDLSIWRALATRAGGENVQ